MHKLIMAAAAIAALPAHADISVTTPSFTYSQNFDSLSTSSTAVAWANDSTLAGWSLFTSTGAAAPTYIAPNTNTGSFKSLGTSGSSERALGSTGSGGTYYGSPASGAVAGWMALALTNNTGAELSGFTLGFDGEQWFNGGNTSAQTLVMEYGFGSSFATVTGWTAPLGSFNFSSPVTGSTSATVDGNSAGLVTGLGGSISTPWAAGDTLWLRWVERNDTGNDHTLAIDNLSLSVSAVPEPAPGALLLAGLAAVAFVARRRAPR